MLTSNPPVKHLTFKDTNMNTKEDENETNVDETLITTTDKMKRTYFYVKKTECVSILVCRAQRKNENLGLIQSYNKK
jgi:hypothetical protein